MLYEKDSYLEVKAGFTDDSIDIGYNGDTYRIIYPIYIWKPLDEPIKRSITDHVAFMSTNYLPLVLGKKGVMYDTRLPMLDCFSFKSMIYDLPSCAVNDSKNTLDYLKRYYNLDFVFNPEEAIVWSKTFEPEKTAIISFTSGKESLLTLAICMELGLKPILINVVEPSNTYEQNHKAQILRELSEEFSIEYHTVPHEPGFFHDANHMRTKATSLGWGNQLLYYMLIYIPFIIHHRASYLFYGNEFSCDNETSNLEGFRTNFCYDQSSHWTTQLDIAMRLLTGGSTRVGSLVGPLNEIAVTKCLHEGFPKLAKYQMSCFCDEPTAEDYRWCCNCSKCARNYAFMKAFNIDVKGLGFWRDMFREDCLNLYPILGGQNTFGYDQSGLGRNEQELALFLALENLPDNELLRNFTKISKYNGSGQGGVDPQFLLKKDYEFYFGVQPYPAIPKELREDVYKIYRRILLQT